MAAIVMGIGLGCFMYAFVNDRYNDKTWAKSKYFWGAGVIAILIGMFLLFI